MAPGICGQKRQGEQDEVIKGYDLFRHDVKKYVFCVSVGISLFHMEREKVLLFDVFFLIVFLNNLKSAWFITYGCIPIQSSMIADTIGSCTFFGVRVHFLDIRIIHFTSTFFSVNGRCFVKIIFKQICETCICEIFVHIIFFCPIKYSIRWLPYAVLTWPPSKKRCQRYFRWFFLFQKITCLLEFRDVIWGKVTHPSDHSPAVCSNPYHLFKPCCY